MATNAVYWKAGTPITLRNTGGTYAFSPASVANGAGRISTQIDFGAPSTARAIYYQLSGESQCQATPTVNNLLRHYMAWAEESDTYIQGGIGTTDAAFATEANLVEMDYVGNTVVRAAAADTRFLVRGSPVFAVPSFARYGTFVLWNASGASLTADNAEHIYYLTPVFPDIQAAA